MAPPKKPRQPRRLEPPYEAEPRPYTMTGTLIRTYDSGYGFLMTGKGMPDHFILRSQVPHDAWIKGARFGFDPKPAKDGKSAPRVDNPVVISIPGEVAR
jgi:hypothetical protein